MKHIGVGYPSLRWMIFTVIKHLCFHAQAASSPKCVLWTMKRGEDGVAVKVHRRSKP